jgi:hypothetical protein
MNFKQSILALAILLAFAATSFAQNQQYKHTISGSAGLNLFQALPLIEDALQDSLGGEVDIRATGSYGLQYDYGVTKWFSIGLSATTNNFELRATQFEVDREDGTTYKGLVDLKARRNNITIRPLFHYGNSRRLDLYTGFRLGASIWTGEFDYDRTQPPITPSDVNDRVRGTSANFTGQFIPFGLRGYVTENIGLGFEVGIGAPSFAALQLNYRL